MSKYLPTIVAYLFYLDKLLLSITIDIVSQTQTYTFKIILIHLEIEYNIVKMFSYNEKK